MYVCDTSGLEALQREASGSNFDLRVILKYVTEGVGGAGREVPVWARSFINPRVTPDTLRLKIEDCGL